ncbi:hypothetical protein [Ollibium composti]|uniref:hypothetical protein n=1 Tax=Ollibium composti TaxID=2675109 RepID=UPI001454BD83|nr:hypothetical protein [Mesorhizobium composti]
MRDVWRRATTSPGLGEVKMLFSIWKAAHYLLLFLMFGYLAFGIGKLIAPLFWR